MVTVPLQAQPNQQLKIVLGGQNCQISVYMRGSYLFMDLNVNGQEIFSGASVRSFILQNPCPYRPFVGDFIFVDEQGIDDPVYTGLGSRWQLVYLSDEERNEFLS